MEIVAAVEGEDTRKYRGAYNRTAYENGNDALSEAGHAAKFTLNLYETSAKVPAHAKRAVAE